jgi:peroxiredoxin/glutaredoxin
MTAAATASGEQFQGRRVPDATFHVLDKGELRELPSRALFAGQTVALFALPGAFTPTCSNRHVPRFAELAPALRGAGVDEIVCVSVNDPWVMDAWARQQGTDQIRFVADADGAFTRGLGMLVHQDVLGPRSRRYSMLVRNGVIERAFPEADEPGDPYRVSDADTLLRNLDPRAPALQPVALLARRGCPFCERALTLLREHDLPFEVLWVGEHGQSMQAVLAISGESTVPQVFIGGQRIGGVEALERHLEERRRPRARAA